MIWLVFILLAPGTVNKDAAYDIQRPVRYAVYKAHTILPETLRFLVKSNGKHLFEGLAEGMTVAPDQVTLELIMAEKAKITRMIDQQRPFSAVVHQMGYVSGLVSIYTNPSYDGSQAVRHGFVFYLNYKLDRYRFVFDGYPDPPTGNLPLEKGLAQVGNRKTDFLNVLEKRYASVSGNPYYRFDERSAVYGVTSIYFSNLAGFSAYLWYDAWAAANGDTANTPFLRSK